MWEYLTTAITVVLFAGMASAAVGYLAYKLLRSVDAANRDPYLPLEKVDLEEMAERFNSEEFQSKPIEEQRKDFISLTNRIISQHTKGKNNDRTENETKDR